MTFLPAGIELLKRFEGCSLKAYPDPATKSDPWTIGFGHTGNVKHDDEITEGQAVEILRSDVLLFSSRVRAAVHPSLNDFQFTAAVCFAFNVRGWASLPLFGFLADGDLESAKAHWCLYCKAGGQIMEGLKKRREAELLLFLTPP